MATWFVSVVKVYWGLNFLYCPLKNPSFFKRRVFDLTQNDKAGLYSLRGLCLKKNYIHRDKNMKGLICILDTLVNFQNLI